MEIVLPEHVTAVIDRLERNGCEAYAVGGCVRDMLLGEKPKDYDITTSARPEQVEECFKDCRIIETGIKHGTVTVVSGGESIEITTYRTDGKYSDHRRPDSVSFAAKIEDDLARRDFTVNAMAYSPERGLVDPFGGRYDLRNGVLRCVGEPEKRFEEDALRIMRALRFSAQLFFSIDEKTGEAIHKKKDLLKEISAERISAELMRMLSEYPPACLLNEFKDVFAVIIPEIGPCIGFEQHNRYHSFDVWGHIAEAVGACLSDKPEVGLALLLHDIGKPQCFSLDENGGGHFHGHASISAEMAEKILVRMRFPARTVKTVTTLIHYHYIKLENSDASVKRLLSKIGSENFFMLMDVIAADNRAKEDFCEARAETAEAMAKRAERILEDKECVRLSDLAADGNDMLELGLEGSGVGEMLGKLLEAVFDGAVPNEKAALLEFAEKLKNDNI